MEASWTEAIKETEEYGFYSNDIIKKYDEEETHIITATDLCILSEGAEKLRHKEEATAFLPILKGLGILPKRL